MTDMPGLVNLRQDPFERTPSINGESLNQLSGGYMNDFYAREFWRFVLVQEKVAELAKTAIDCPPMQDPASFNSGCNREEDRCNIKDPTAGNKWPSPSERLLAGLTRVPAWKNL